MEIQQLREFAAIAETGSFSKAARRLRIAQPPLSRHIRQLEDELGIKLFVRTAIGVQLTREGAMLLQQARTVLEDASALVDLATRARAGRASTLRVAMAPGLCEVVNRIRIHLVKTVPQLSIEGTDMSSAQQYAAIRRRLVDVGLLRHLSEDAEIETEPLFGERFVVLVSETHPLAKKRTLKLKQLAGEPLLLQDRDWAALAHDKFLSMYAAAGVTPNVATREATPGNQASMLAVASGEAICLSSSGSFSRSYVPLNGLAAIPLDEPDAELYVQVAWRKGETSTVLCDFLKAARQLFHRT
jgi:DNA-binding transcriptional LysR family regulator